VRGLPPGAVMASPFGNDETRTQLSAHFRHCKGGAELPLPALRRQASRWARGWVGGPRARSRTPPPPGPIYEKKQVPRREADFAPKPTALQTG
jgi:hypothetical protein